MEAVERQLIGFWKKFSRMLSSGMPILETLSTVAKEIPDKKLRQAVEGMAAGIRQGKNMSDSLARYSEFFSPTVIHLVRVGEIAGALDTNVQEIVKGLEDGTFPVGGGVAESVAEAEDEPIVVRLVADMIREAVHKAASDIHLERNGDDVRVRYRVDGVLEDAPDRVPKGMAGQVISRLKIMADLDVAEKRLPQDGRIMVEVEGKKLDIRMNVSPYVMGEGIAMRILDRGVSLVGLEDQGLSPKQLETLRAWARKPSGIVILTGPTGCGKTTTIYSLLQELNTPEVKITTVEDPVEFLIEGINQQQLNPRIGLTFEHSIRSHLRQATNIMMIGEIRNLETAHLVIQAALTGHQIFTTLHTNDCPSTIRRLLDIGIAPFLVNSTLTGVMTQRLVRKVCPDCREEYQPADWMLEGLELDEDVTFYRGKGCDKCRNTGFHGRTAIHELMGMDDDLRRVTARDAGDDELRAQAIASGMVTLKQDGIAKAAEGITTIEEVMRVCG